MSIPVNRIIEKLDSYLHKKDYSAAEAHLAYWLKEAEETFDDRGKLTVLNELVGLYRKIGQERQALTNADAAVALAEKMYRGEDTLSSGTTYLNAATAYKAFDRNDEALKLYRRAKDVYDKVLPENDGCKAGLYNNMAIALKDARQFALARDYFCKAIDILTAEEDEEGKVAVTLCNLCDLAEDEKGRDNAWDEIMRYLYEAKNNFDKCSSRNGEYAFMCEKCAPTFARYGFEEYASILTERAKEIYERY